MANPYTKPFALRNQFTAVALIGLLWAMPWIVWPGGHPLPAVKRGGFVPQVTYLRTAAGMDGSPWSPVLLSRPSQWGFSHTAKESDSNVLAILKPRVMDASYFERGADAVSPPDFTDAGVTPDVRGADYQPRGVEQAVFARVPAVGREGMQVEVYDGLKERGFECTALSVLRLPELVTAWVSVTASVETDARGQVAHVFLESPSGKVELDEAVVRALYRGRGLPGRGAAEGRVKITYWRHEPAEAQAGTPR
jgi:hypothetical protein